MSSVSKSILLVDDDQEIRELLDTYLSRAGFQVRTVGDGAGFRQAFNEASSDLLILDVMLPDEDGFSLCRWVRQHPRQPHVPIIMLTASSDEADRVIGLSWAPTIIWASRSARVSFRRGSRRCCAARSSVRNVPVATLSCSTSGAWTWSVTGCFTTTAKK